MIIWPENGGTLFETFISVVYANENNKYINGSCDGGVFILIHRTRKSLFMYMSLAALSEISVF